MELQEVLIFDTETTGVPEKGATWDVDFETYPHIVQLAWMVGDRAESCIIRPDGWEIPEEATAIHGITNEIANEFGKPFGIVIDRFLKDCINSPLICGHNIHFDTSVIKANIIRELGWDYYEVADVEAALYKGKRIDTMRPTMKWVDARTANGRLKFPRLEELYSRCFPGETFPAHDAAEDVKAVARCLPVILEKGLIELKVKEYAEENAESAEKAIKSPITNANEKDGKLPVSPVQAPQIENSEKITELLQQNDF